MQINKLKQAFKKNLLKRVKNEETRIRQAIKNKIEAKRECL